jgi:Tfp pilus assembly protein FimT
VPDNEQELTEVLDAIKKWLPDKDTNPMTAIIGVAVIMILIGLTLFSSWLRRKQLATLEDDKRKLEAELENLRVTKALKENEDCQQQLQLHINAKNVLINASKKREEEFCRTVDKAIEQLKEVKTWAALDGEFDKRSRP